MPVKCLSHPWILEENVAHLTVISTINLKKFLARLRKTHNFFVVGEPLRSGYPHPPPPPQTIFCSSIVCFDVVCFSGTGGLIGFTGFTVPKISTSIWTSKKHLTLARDLIMHLCMKIVALRKPKQLCFNFSSFVVSERSNNPCRFYCPKISTSICNYYRIIIEGICI